MKTLILVAALFASVCFVRAVTVSAPTNTPPAHIVTLRGDADPEAVVRDFGLTPRCCYHYACKGFAATVPANQLAALRADPRVLAVESNGRVYPCTQVNSTGWARMGMNHFPMVHYGTKINVDVAIIDSGVQSDHPDLNVYRSITTGGDNLPPDDLLGHGTHVAGICGALDNDLGVVGVAPGVRIWSIRYLHRVTDNSGTFIFGDWDSVTEGLDYVAQHADEISVVNMSFSNNGSGPAPWTILDQVFSNLVSHGVSLIAAVGNNGPGTDLLGSSRTLRADDNLMPAAHPLVCAVSAMDSEPDYDALAWFSVSCDSNYKSNYVNSPGGGIDVCAPGVDILSTYLTNSYATLSGSSMAAPAVAGVTALYIAANGRATNFAGAMKIRQAIIDAALPQSAWNTNLYGETGDSDGHYEGMAQPSLSWIPALKFTGAQKQTNGLALNFTTLPGYAHTVQYRAALTGTGAWTNLFTTNGTGDRCTVLDTSATNTTRFYRLATAPAP